MKDIRILCMLIAAALLAACGSATEVGNPTGDTPPTRTVTGVVDTTTLSATADASDLNQIKEAESLAPHQYNVVATAEGIDVVESPLDAQHRFTLEVRIGLTYAWELRLGSTKIGDLSFSQGSSGARSNSLRIEAEGEAIDLGQLQYQHGAFYPQYEPVDAPGVGDQPEGNQGDGGDGGGQGPGGP